MGNGFAPIVSLAGLFVGAAIAIACVGDSEVEVPFAATPSVGPEGGVSEGGSEPASCPQPDLTPGGCQVKQDYCAPLNGTPSCIAEDGECATAAAMRCLGSASCDGRPCCYNGPIVIGNACAKTGVANSTLCGTAPVPGSAVCGDKGRLTCLTDNDCQPFAAGKCVTMLIGASKRSIGICSGS